MIIDFAENLYRQPQGFPLCFRYHYRVEGLSMTVFLNILTLLIFAILWEGVAWFMHKYVMHGIGWYFHEDHHKTSGKRMQKNDAYALFFALISFLLIYNGLRMEISYIASAGFGVALYGIGYVLFHEIIFHKRIKGLKIKVNHPYMKRIIASHRVHHSVITKEGASNFSFLWAPRQK